MEFCNELKRYYFMSLMRGQKGVLMLQSLIVQPIASWEIE